MTQVQGEQDIVLVIRHLHNNIVGSMLRVAFKFIISEFVRGKKDKVRRTWIATNLHIVSRYPEVSVFLWVTCKAATNIGDPRWPDTLTTFVYSLCQRAVNVYNFFERIYFILSSH